MKQLFEVLKAVLTLFDPQLQGITANLRLKSPTIYTIVIALLFGADKWIYEAQKAGVLTLSETGVFVLWLISFLLAMFTRPAIGTQSIDTPYMMSKDEYENEKK